ncbi:hypothetical protein M5689_020962 [Euphorbia peplus]|nr:hypothetical protein M5689_020962 [Euphorbia peplus]
MEETTQSSYKVKGKVEKYKVWTSEESNELLKLMVDAANRGWRDSNGSLSKVTVEKKILPALNDKIGCEKTYSQYQSRLKWFKQRYINYCNLLHFSSGFGWDPVTKKFIAPEEVWEDYFKVHSTIRNYRIDTFGDYEDLRIAVGNGTAIGRHAIGLGDDTNARIDVEEEEIEEESPTHVSLDDLVFDPHTASFIQNDIHGTLYKSSSQYQNSSTLPSAPMNQEVPQATKKRSMSDFEGKSTSNESTNQLDIMSKFIHSVDKLANAMKSLDNNECSCWKLIKEIPELDKLARFKAPELLNTRAKKKEFLEMSPEDRLEWIVLKIQQ